jgi:hypothetical protein
MNGKVLKHFKRGVRLDSSGPIPDLVAGSCGTAITLLVCIKPGEFDDQLISQEGVS